MTVDREANQIRLRRSTFSGTFLLVEGSSDKTFYDRFVDKAACQLVSVSGKPSSKLRVIAVLEILEKSTFQGILAIIDADFERLETFIYSSPNLLRTDTHDLETMLINSPALNKVVAEFASEEKIVAQDRTSSNLTPLSFSLEADSLYNRCCHQPNSYTQTSDSYSCENWML
nr:DUF4435 domain-containing protein [Scytonema sp. UIC 10036]